MSEDRQIVWDNTVDNGTWRVWVERTDNYKGVLLVERISTGERVLEEEVGLAYQAIFGPDVADVNQWQNKAIEVIDAEYEKDKNKDG